VERDWNVLVHGYDVVDSEQVWAAVTEDLAHLVDSIEGLIGERPSGPEPRDVLRRFPPIPQDLLLEMTSRTQRQRTLLVRRLNLPRFSGHLD
jgi:hypothetical protein